MFPSKAKSGEPLSEMIFLMALRKMRYGNVTLEGTVLIPAEVIGEGGGEDCLMAITYP